jgi:RNA-directed DNA polymerase
VSRKLNKGKNLKDQLAHGFKRDCSIITNAVKHRKRRYVFNVDLNDFFGTINFGRVRGFFIKDANFMLHANVATILAQIACNENVLPQGSPCSPVISNLIGHVLDIHLCKLASTNGCTYSRYADDITFSTGKPDFPMGIAKRVVGQTHIWDVGDGLKNIVTHTGFSINPKKTRMQYRGSRQAVTGLVVNRKVNVRSEYRRKARSLAHNLFKTGSFQHLRTIVDANGVVTPTAVEGTPAQLHGILGFIDAVDFEVESKVDSRKAKATLRAKEKLYRRFLMFKDFYAAKEPVIVCEGKTNNVEAA